MTPEDFIRKWRASTLTERSASQSHFLDLCTLLGEATPTDSDPTGAVYTFEKGATKTTGGKGWADVWTRGCFAWEYKGRHKNLTAAFAQLQQYGPVLESPPLLVVSDMEQIDIHTNWTNAVAEVHANIAFEGLTGGLVHAGNLGRSSGMKIQTDPLPDAGMTCARSVPPG